MSIAFFNTDLEREFAKYAICKESFLYLLNHKFWTGDNFAIYLIANFGSSIIFAFSLKLRFAKC